MIPDHIKRQVVCNENQDDKLHLRRGLYKDLFDRLHPELFQTDIMSTSSNNPSKADTKLSPIQTGGQLCSLVVPSDRDKLTDYVFLILQQYEFCLFTEEDRKTYRRGTDIEIGFPGMACKHCRYTRYFRASVDSLRRFEFTDKRVVHLLECHATPNDVKFAIKKAWKSHKIQGDKLNRGFLVSFCRKLWDRMCTAKYFQKSELSTTQNSSAIDNASLSATHSVNSIVRENRKSTALSGMAAALAAKQSELIQLKSGPEEEDLSDRDVSCVTTLAPNDGIAKKKEPSMNTFANVPYATNVLSSTQISSDSDGSFRPYEAKRVVTDFMDCIMKNVKILKISANSEENKYSAEVCCKHCGGVIDKGTGSFVCTSPLDVSSLGSYATEHLLNCYDVSSDIKEMLQTYFASHYDQLECLEHGSVSKYFEN
eukprot:CAMPEP_0116010710 /NCGR_PEP_ID=MMETSP0321-20121206/4151_1 /TAXON_ID=163516 /ORGANISM="Leptocylindrus danicus var. danicus, Strain B650" /LENGTH=424 /DNA_ID=CAMNT_0003479837 /DNA_START=616 /DNA_END=1887 /DNA_ORIENTATION=-